MPVYESNPERYRQLHREGFLKRYAQDGKFRSAEAQRKALWYAKKAEDPQWLAARAEKARVRRGTK